MRITTILSGGIDSTVLLYKALSETKDASDVCALSFDYGQRHKKELMFAAETTKERGIEHKIVDISVIQELLSASVLTDASQDVPEGHYAQENMKQTVVPNRNAIMLSIAYGYAVNNQSSKVYFGAHAGDHFIYPDCRREFVKALDAAFYLGNLGFADIDLSAPFIHLSKAQIVNLGIVLQVPFEKTWSCYKGLERPCGHCGTCVERTEAFMLNDEKDPAMTDAEWNDSVAYLKQMKP
jgi:7-cyano-7-deazaguanine synthase